MARSRTPLRILCFGDSLTSGYHNYGLGEHPYSDALLDRLAAVLPDDSYDLEALADGEPGDVASRPAFQRRLREQLEERSFDWVIVLGGTNDLAYSISPHAIFNALKTCWDLALANGSKVLALTVPECAAKSASLDATRRGLNASILNYKQTNFYALDLFAKIPYHSLLEQDRDAFWDDGLHLTADGYDWMGRHIADGLLAILKQHDQPEAAKPATRKRRTKSDGDGQAFDEETGSPDVISQGYVVVRRRDLD
ncbi:GDSL-like lipase/Acylhydrolase family protein [Hirsutella rhossiliensis]|uniref:GDSL-like lipase/Acylhydrolase family domain-containing protein n=1 Tax=Hirsutella rhossiliensis TaxID=111463 RepID=A0A9P8N2Q0_9HYPO|nr:GDSL-like lipase/Acylhydrolase family domain-containing protein [Hirsutella rhossiliensis]KAH0967193.1 GDSL-like lipase/Acylhydrolase family domain-containing protein [Hirsutella rhossiliensis]